MTSLDRFAYEVKDVASIAEPARTAVEKELLPGEGVRQIVFAPPHDGAAGAGWAVGYRGARPRPGCSC